MTKRIDLTQFDAITKGDWELIDTPNGGIDIGVRQAGGHNPVVNFTQSMGAQVRNISRDVADMNAIAAVPKLIAELKRCYEVMNEVILRAMDAREEEASDMIRHGDEVYVHVDEITYPFSKSDIDAALDSKASE